MVDLFRALYREVGRTLPLAVALTAIVTAAEGTAVVVVYAILSRIFPPSELQEAPTDAFLPGTVPPLALVAGLVGIGALHAVLTFTSQAVNQHMLEGFVTRLQNHIMSVILLRRESSRRKW